MTTAVKLLDGTTVHISDTETRALLGALALTESTPPPGPRVLFWDEANRSRTVTQGTKNALIRHGLAERESTIDPCDGLAYVRLTTEGVRIAKLLRGDERVAAEATDPESRTQVWVLSEESRLNACPGDEITLFPTEAAAQRERLRRVHERWSELPLFEDDPAVPPADPEEAIQIYNEAREGERLNAPWPEYIAPVPGCRARFLWPDAEQGAEERADPAIKIGGIIVGVREEPQGLVVWIDTEGADESWPLGPAGEVPLEVVVNDEVVVGGLAQGHSAQQANTEPVSQTYESEWGVLNHEGCTFVGSHAQMEAGAAHERAEDEGYYAELISVHPICPNHEEQPQGACEECLAHPEEDEGTEIPTPHELFSDHDPSPAWAKPSLPASFEGRVIAHAGQTLGCDSDQVDSPMVRAAITALINAGFTPFTVEGEFDPQPEDGTSGFYVQARHPNTGEEIVYVHDVLDGVLTWSRDTESKLNAYATALRDAGWSVPTGPSRAIRALPPAEPTRTEGEQNAPAPLPKPAPGFFTLVGTIDLSEHGHTLDGHRYPGTAEGFDQFAEEIERRAQGLDDTAGLVDALIKAARQSATVHRIAAGLGTSGARVLVSASPTGQATGHPASLAALTRKNLLGQVQEEGRTVYYRTPLGVAVARARYLMDTARIL